MCASWSLRVLDGVTDGKVFSSLNVPQDPTLNRGRQLSSGASGLGLLTKLLIVNGHSARLLRLRIISLTGDLCPIFFSGENGTNLIFSLGERYGLRIIPGANSFLVIPNNISRQTAIGAILHPGGPGRVSGGLTAASFTLEASDFDSPNGVDFILAIGTDEKLLRRLNEFDNAETCSTASPNKGTDAKWRLQFEEVRGVLTQLASTTV